MLKDLIQSLQQGTEQIESRMAGGQSVLSSAVRSTSSAPSPARNSRGGRVGMQGLPAGKLGSFLKAIAEQESGGNYDARGVQTKYGQALGKYQILDSNIAGSGGWDKEILGRNISPNRFLNSPKLQEKIARGKLTSYFRQYGPSGAAKAWYAGPGNANTNSNASQYGGPSINDYAAQVLARMRK